MELTNQTVAGIIKPLVNVQEKLKKHIEAKNKCVETCDKKIEEVAKKKTTAEGEINKARAYITKIDSFLDIADVETPAEISS